ncbi:MAG: IMP dehydrogenase, partial [Phycisphaerae bacterium]|nr:IMP dehydrogenase [Phycisphaerae bacterium]
TDDDVRLTMGGEPTFVSIDDMESPEWTVGAVGEHKRRLSDELVRRLGDRFAAGPLLHFGQGKWYPGESLPRWAYGAYWRKDGKAVWEDHALVAETSKPEGHTPPDAERFVARLAEALGVPGEYAVPAYEDAMYYAWKENRLPPNVTAGDAKASTDEDRRRLARIFDQGLDTPTGFALPLKEPHSVGGAWVTGSWPVRAEHMFLIPGDSPMGLRLPLDALSNVPERLILREAAVDPMRERPPLPEPLIQRAGVTSGSKADRRGGRSTGVADRRGLAVYAPATIADIPGQVRTALCVEPREGTLRIFMPPIETLEHYLDLVGAIELTASELGLRVLIEGYTPPYDPRMEVIKVTPDPGVIEVNIHPAPSWDALADTTDALYEEARLTRLGAEKFDLDGTHTGTGGGNHVVLGGATPADSPFLRRPDLLGSLLRYWVNHPSLSYLFSSRFIGPTSQAPRVDEGRPDALYELELALRTLDREGREAPPWIVDRVFRHLLTDMSGNTHRAEICIDKLFSPDSSTGRLGLVELRGFEMPPHPRMSLTQQLLIRSLVSHFWREPNRRKPTHWRTSLHDRFMLPHFIREDFHDVLDDLREGGVALDPAWFDPHFEFRFPAIGSFAQRSIDVELRTAIEPWYVLGEEPAGGGTSRAVDSSVERLQVRVSGMNDDRHVVACNGRRVPLHPTGVEGEFVAGVRYRAWQPPRCLHPTIRVHTPLVFDVVDTWQDRSIGGCVYHVSNPSGVNSDRFPVNAFEAESRRAARFELGGHSPGRVRAPEEAVNGRFPMTLDLRG